MKHATINNKDLAWGENGRPERLHSSAVIINNDGGHLAYLHFTAVRIVWTDTEKYLYMAAHGLDQSDLDRAQSLDPDEVFQPAPLEGFDGEWVVWATPFCA